MAENKTGGIDQQTLMYVLIGVVVVLIAVVGFMIYQRSQPSGIVPAGGQGAAAQQLQGQAAQTDPNAAQGGTGQNAQPPAGMGGGSSAGGPVDPKTSTKVTGGDPQAFVQKYYAAAVKGDWKTCYAMLPAANRAQSTQEQFAETQQGYGIKSFKVASKNEQGNKATVTVSMSTASFGEFSNQWSFEKVGNDWYVAGKKTMMGGQ